VREESRERKEKKRKKEENKIKIVTDNGSHIWERLLVICCNISLNNSTK
jgi:hypothetical protein